MARTGKIARLPRGTREELNRRLDDGENGVRLVQWLNTLPEVKEVLDTYFKGRAITEPNLTEWRHGGFAEWKERQETMDLARDMTEDGTEFAEVCAHVADAVESVTLTHYAATLQRSNVGSTEEPAKRLDRLSKSLKDVDRLRAREQATERLELERQWFELAKQKAQFARRGKTGGEAEETIPGQPAGLSHQEKADWLKKMLVAEREEKNK